ICIADEIIRLPDYREVAFLVDVEVRPPYPGPLRTALDDVHETIPLHPAILVEQLTSEVGLPKLEAGSGARWQFHPGAVTSLVRKNELVRFALPDDDDRLLRIEVSVWRAGEVALVVAKHVVADFHGPHSLDLHFRQFCHAHRRSILEHWSGPADIFRIRPPWLVRLWWDSALFTTQPTHRGSGDPFCHCPQEGATS